MAVLGWLWLGSPFVVIALISNDPELLASVARNLKRCRMIGATGAAGMVLGVMLVPGPVGVLMFIIGTPLTGLIVWAVMTETTAVSSRPRCRRSTGTSSMTPSPRMCAGVRVSAAGHALRRRGDRAAALNWLAPGKAPP